MRLRVPEGVEGAQELPVQGYAAGVRAFREQDLQIGSYTVTQIERDWDQARSKSVAGGAFAREAKKKAYRFALRAQARSLQAECTEAWKARGLSGITASNVALTCTCREGEAPHTEIELTNGKGTLRTAGDLRYELLALHEGEQGTRSSAALGYALHGPHGSAAVDVSGHGRAFLPRDLGEEEALGLVCGFASLFLYRPTQ